MTLRAACKNWNQLGIAILHFYFIASSFTAWLLTADAYTTTIMPQINWFNPGTFGGTSTQGFEPIKTFPKGHNIIWPPANQYFEALFYASKHFLMLQSA